jgi:hypothetical protein
VTGGDRELPAATQRLGDLIGHAFVAGRFADVHALATADFQKRNDREQFAARWEDTARERGPFTGFEVVDAGPIDLGFIPGLEETPQDQFVAFLEIAFATEEIPVEDKRAFVVGAVLLDIDGDTRLGAIHVQTG